MDQLRRARLGGATLHYAKAQLTLVEHALCPLDAAQSLRPGFIHETSFFYTDKNRNRRKANARIGALDGLSASDEFYLWGLLSLALAQSVPSPDFYATPFYVLNRLGVISSAKRGGREFMLFRAAIRRLAAVRYQNDHFYDPVRGEHRQVSFGFLNYSLPLDPLSARAWRFAWDPIFWELAKATGGALSFDLTLYRELDTASRRLYLYLKKLFFRNTETGWIDVQHLTTDVLGFSKTHPGYTLKHKLSRCLDQFLRLDLLRLPAGVLNRQGLFRELESRKQVVQLFRGERFSVSHSPHVPIKSPLVDPLKAIGLDTKTIEHVLSTYSHRQIETWSDITLAALEAKGESYFTRSPAAYFIDNLQCAARGARTPPDWWHEHRKRELAQEAAQERRKQSALDKQAADTQFDDYLQNEAKAAFENVIQRLLGDFTRSGKSAGEASALAEQFARQHFAAKFCREFPTTKHREVDPGDDTTISS